ncbi:MAG TPA: hypothetical protein VN802_07750 [Stellaceae bacterium]|nr:hypothetical protein [Stellaceae bacterium]
MAETLARAAGLPAAKLIESRNRRIEAASPPAEAAWVDQTSVPMFEAVQALRGKVIPPSVQALRLWDTSRASDPDGAASESIFINRPHAAMSARLHP